MNDLLDYLPMDLETVQFSTEVIWNIMTKHFDDHESIGNHIRLYEIEEESTMRIKCYARLIGLVCFGILLASPCPAATNEQQILTLSDAIETALKNHPAIEAQYGQVLSAEAKKGQAWGGLYPHLSISSEYSMVRSDSTQTSSTSPFEDLFGGSYLPSDISSSQEESYQKHAATANLSLLIWDFGKTFAQIKSQKLNAEAARLGLVNTRDEVIFNVKQAYFGLLSAQSTRDVAAEAVAQFNKHLEYARAKFEVGSKPKFDVTKAEVDLSNAKVDLIKAENAVKLAVAVLNNAIGLPNIYDYTVEEDTPSIGTEYSFEDAERSAFECRADLLSLQKQKRSAMETIKAAKGAHYPVLNSTANLTYGETKDTHGHAWSAGLNLTIPIFSGFVTYYQVAEAQANLRVAAANERNLIQTIFLDLEQGFLALREAAERIKSTETVVKQARENLELANERYSAGLAIGVEVTDAVVSYANAKMSNITARYDYKIAQARIEKAIGGASR